VTRFVKTYTPVLLQFFNFEISKQSDRGTFVWNFSWSFSFWLLFIWNLSMHTLGVNWYAYTLACRRCGKVPFTNLQVAYSIFVTCWRIMVVSYSTVVLYININDHGGLRFSAKRYHQKPSFYHSLEALIRHCRSQKYLQINPEPFQQVVMKF